MLSAFWNRFGAIQIYLLKFTYLQSIRVTPKAGDKQLVLTNVFVDIINRLINEHRIVAGMFQFGRPIGYTYLGASCWRCVLQWKGRRRGMGPSEIAFARSTLKSRRPTATLSPRRQTSLRPRPTRQANTTIVGLQHSVRLAICPDLPTRQECYAGGSLLGTTTLP